VGDEAASPQFLAEAVDDQHEADHPAASARPPGHDHLASAELRGRMNALDMPESVNGQVETDGGNKAR
jgi:hypothetical protein